MIKINIQIEVALIAASAAILGSLVPQLFTHFSKKESYKEELRKEYKINKVKTYQILSEMIINMWIDDVKMDDGHEWTGIYITEFEKFKVSYGIWLEDDEMDMINEIQKKFSDISKSEILGTEYDGSESLDKKVKRLQNLCRRRLKEEYYITSK